MTEERANAKRRKWPWILLQFLSAIGVAFGLLLLAQGVRYIQPDFAALKYEESTTFEKALKDEYTSISYSIAEDEMRRLFRSLPDDALIGADIMELAPADVILILRDVAKNPTGDYMSIPRHRLSNDMEPPESGNGGVAVPVYRKGDLVRWAKEGVRYHQVKFYLFPTENDSVIYRRADLPKRELYEGLQDWQIGGASPVVKDVLREDYAPVGYKSLTDFAAKNKQEGDRYLTVVAELLQSPLFRDRRESEVLPVSNLRVTAKLGDRTITNAGADWKGADFSAPFEFTRAGSGAPYVKSDGSLPGIPKDAEMSERGMRQSMIPGETIRFELDRKLSKDDDLARLKTLFEKQLSSRLWGLGIACVSVLVWAISLVFCLRNAGYQTADSPLRTAERAIPAECYLLFLPLIWAVVLPWVMTADSWMFSFAGKNGGIPAELQLLPLYVIALIASFAVVPEAMGLYAATAVARKWKEKRLWNGSIVQGLVRLFRSIFGYLRDLGSSGYSMIAIFSVSVLFALFFFHVSRVVSGVIFLFIASCGVLILRRESELNRLSKEIARLAEGGKAEEIDPSEYHGMFRKMAKELASLEEDIARTIAESVKNERMQSELITNVSHDIRTPLTSIINYVDLLSRLELKDERAREYVAVLAKKSQRLKHLMDDLIDASRASSGAITIQSERFNLAELVRQVAGEYDGRWEERGLSLVLDMPEGSIPVMADGRHLFRVLDNVLNNARKYSMPGTRVYARVWKSGESACFECKNTSERELNIPPEQLLERFKRGDESRTTEGSGLGLSIAENLTRLMGGRFEIAIDGDLFKVTVRIP